MKKMIPNRPIEPILYSAENYNFILRNINECADEHRKCNRGEGSLLPTRVLQILSSSGPSRNILRLYEPEDEGIAKYAALSYCWGGDQSFKTTTSNLDDYKVGIDEARLPQTIRDAIKVSRLLRLQYLWIDSLCIIQDSQTDMLKELSRTRFTYQNSFITIAANSAQSVEEGFLDTSDKPEPMTFRVPCFDRKGRPGTMYLTPCTPVEKQPINRRAWCLVEYMLSRRYLAFDTDQRTIQFYCRDNYCSNGGNRNFLGLHDAQTRIIFSNPLSEGRELTGNLDQPDDGSENTKDDSNEGSDEDSKAGSNAGSEEGSDEDLDEDSDEESDEWTASSATGEQDELMALWNHTVRNFTSRQLTMAEDSLPALSGVANAFHSLWGGKYLAGLWEVHFPHCLLWRLTSNPSLYDESERWSVWTTNEPYESVQGIMTTKSHLPNKRPIDSQGRFLYRAPTWAWASVDGEVRYTERDTDDDTDDDVEEIAERASLHPVLVESEVELLSMDDPFGRVTGGRIVIDGVMVEPPTDFCWYNAHTGQYQLTPPSTKTDVSQTTDDIDTGEGVFTKRNRKTADANSYTSDEANSDSESDSSDVYTISDLDIEACGYLDVTSEAPQTGDRVTCLLLDTPTGVAESIGLLLWKSQGARDEDPWRRIGTFENVELDLFKAKARDVVTIV